MTTTEATTCPRCSAPSYPDLLCKSCQEVSDAEYLPPWEVYALARRCSYCKTPAGSECPLPRKRAEHERLNQIRVSLGYAPDPVPPQFHTQREDAGIRQRENDQGKAPWPEEREPGRCYCSLKPCPRAVVTPPAALTRRELADARRHAGPAQSVLSALEDQQRQ